MPKKAKKKTGRKPAVVSPKFLAYQQAVKMNNNGKMKVVKKTDPLYKAVKATYKSLISKL